MKKTAVLFLHAAWWAASTLSAQEAVEKILDLSSASPSSGEVSVQAVDQDFAKGVRVAITPGASGYPGVSITPKGFPVWDLSAFGHVAAKVTNVGSKEFTLLLRVDNKGDWKQTPWNTEQTKIKPGETKDLSVIFGYSYGGKPGYPLKPAEVSNVMLFTAKAAQDIAFRIDSLKAGGPAGQKPTEDSRSIRIKPAAGAVLTPQTVVEAKGGAVAALSADGKTVDIKWDKGQSVVLRPEAGRWDFREANRVRVSLKNTGSAPVSPKLRIASQGGSTGTVSLPAPLAPGATAELAVSFIPATPWRGTVDPRQNTKTEEPNKSWNGMEAGTGTKFTSDAVSGIELAPGEKDGASSLAVASVAADASAAVLPDWLGKCPPAEGDWVRTFTDEFDGNTIDLSRWNIYTSNYWDKKTYFTKDNVIVGGGTVKLRYEKKTGRHNDDPNGKELPYACGFLDTYGKWVQRYGYWESRMKLPKAPGLWPGFWTMPDRGLAAGEQWKRASTEKGGMEFDIAEHLTRWGPYRFNQAFHWDGYNKAHQALGTSQLYFETDKEGFFTAGLLWTPGSAIYYVNGREAGRWETPRICSVESYPIFYMVSGGWDNSPLDDSQLPADYEVDYIRIWQRKDLASPADGVKSARRTPAAPTVPDP
jgi:beta-glucanase (GH16 family)